MTTRLPLPLLSGRPVPSKHKTPLLGWHPPAGLSAWVRAEAARRGCSVSALLTEALDMLRTYLAADPRIAPDAPQWAAVEGDRERLEHARVCSLPYGHEGGHWWDETQEPAPTATDELIRQWHDEAAQLDAQVAQARTAGEGRFQVHGWETRAQALRDCATELWQVATGEIVLREDRRVRCLPGCDRLDGHDGRDTGACN